MNPFIFLAEHGDSIFFFYKEESEPENKAHIFNLYNALTGMNVIQGTNSIVNVYCLFGDNLSMYSLQNSARGELENFDKTNLEELYHFIMIAQRDSNNLVVSFNDDTYESFMSESVRAIDLTPKRELFEIQLVSVNLENKSEE